MMLTMEARDEDVPPTESSSSPSSLASMSTFHATALAAATRTILPELKMESAETEISGTVKISYDGEEARREKDLDISEDLRKEFEKIDNILLEFMRSDEKVNDIRGVKGKEGAGRVFVV